MSVPALPLLGLPDGDKRALVVDDSPTQRLLFTHFLRSWGFQVEQAESGEDALALFATSHFDLILSDWMMPGMTGLDLCREFRTRYPRRYSYFILMTAKNDKSAVAEGLDVGANDFLSKPVAPVELRARIQAGERLLALGRALNARNDDLRATLKELRQVHDALERDLQQARKLQHSLIRDRHRDLGACQISFMLQSSGHVGGDLVGAFTISETRIGVYAIDVSGHGVAAAMLCARVSALFNEGADGQNIAVVRDRQTGEPRAVLPDQVAALMNDLMLRELDSDTYLTLCYADLDLTTGRVSMVQAGHPHPVVQRADGEIEFVGEGGLPIGLIPNAKYASFSVQLQPGDRLLLYSDGVTECLGSDDEEFGSDRLAQLLRKLGHQKGLSFLEAIKWELARWTGRRDFADDVSAVCVEFAEYSARATPKRHAQSGGDIDCV